MLLSCVFIASVLMQRSLSFEYEGDKAKRSEPLTRHKMIHCFDENVRILGPKTFEVEKHDKNEETKTSIIRHKRRAGCTVKTVVSDDEPDDVHGHPHRHHHHRQNHHPKNFETKTSYSISKSVTSPPVEHNFSTRHSSSSDSEISAQEANDHHNGYSDPEELPIIPHLPAIPHIGHEATYPNPQGNARDTTFRGEGEPDPGEKTITFKTNTHRHEIVDQTGFVREKINGYPVRPNDEWRSRFNGMPYLMDENGRIISSAAASSLIPLDSIRQELFVIFLLHCALSALIVL